MVNLGAAVVIRDGQQIVLVQRDDFEVWTVPGGAVEAGESVGDAAIREAREETGLEVELTHLVGVYSRPTWDSHAVIFAARVIGGTARPQAGESLEVRWFDVAALPTDMIWWYRQPIQAAMTEAGTSQVWTQDAVWPAGVDVQDRAALYRWRDAQQLPRAEVYRRFLASSGPDGERRIV